MCIMSHTMSGIRTKLILGTVFIELLILPVLVFSFAERADADFCLSYADCRKIPPLKQSTVFDDGKYYPYDRAIERDCPSYCKNGAKDCTAIWPKSSYKEAPEKYGYCCGGGCVSPWPVSIENFTFQKKTDGYSAWTELSVDVRGKTKNTMWGVQPNTAVELAKECKDRRVLYNQRLKPCGWSDAAPISTQSLGDNRTRYSTSLRNYYSSHPTKCGFTATGMNGFPVAQQFCLRQALPPPPEIKYFTGNGVPDVVFVPRGRLYSIEFSVFGAWEIETKAELIESPGNDEVAQRWKKIADSEISNFNHKHEKWDVDANRGDRDVYTANERKMKNRTASYSMDYTLTARNPGGFTTRYLRVIVLRNSYYDWFKVNPPQGIIFEHSDGVWEYAVEYPFSESETGGKTYGKWTNLYAWSEKRIAQGKGDFKKIGRFDFTRSIDRGDVRGYFSTLWGIDSTHPARFSLANSWGEIHSPERFQSIFGPRPCFSGKTLNVNDVTRGGLFNPRYLTPTFWCSDKDNGLCVDYGPDCNDLLGRDIDLQTNWDNPPNGISLACVLRGFKARIAKCVGQHDKEYQAAYDSATGISYLTEGRYHTKQAVDTIKSFFSALLMSVFAGDGYTKSLSEGTPPPSYINPKCPTCSLVKGSIKGPSGSLILGQGGADPLANDLMKRIGELEAREVGVHSASGLNLNNAVHLNTEPLPYNISKAIVNSCGGSQYCADFAARNAYRPTTRW